MTLGFRFIVLFVLVLALLATTTESFRLKPTKELGTCRTEFFYELFEVKSRRMTTALERMFREQEEMHRAVGEGEDARIDDKNFLRVITINVQSARNNQLEAALRTLQKMKADIGILTKTKITDD